MALTKVFKETVVSRAKHDARFRRSMLVQAVNSMLEGELDVAKYMLRDYINATIMFEPLAKRLHKNSKSLQRMLGPTGNPTMKSLFELLVVLQEQEGIHLTVRG